MEFFPSLPELESTVLCPVDTVATAFSEVPNIKVLLLTPSLMDMHIVYVCNLSPLLPLLICTCTHTQSWLSGANPCACIVVDVERGVLSSVKTQLKLDLTRNLQGPLDHLQTFSKSIAMHV